MIDTSLAPTSGARPYQMCTRCVMDTSDPTITFDAEGVCNYCRYYDQVVVPSRWFPNAEGRRKLEAIVAEMKAAGKGKEYDCILGLSGGVDSAYLAYIAKEELGLRPLAVHVDAGWNSELAVKNIENIVKTLGIDLHTYVVNWEEVRDLQLAYLKASIANQDVVQDHAFFAKLYQEATQKGIRFVLSGGNYATESILPSSWGYNAMDAKQIRAIHKQFGTGKLKDYPTIGFLEYYLVNPYLRKMRVVRPLDYWPYNKAEALKLLEEKLGFRYYGGKHYESRFTKFFQGYYLPRKFGYDKRRAHLSSLIVSGQTTREAALAELEQPAYPPAELAEDLAFVSKKLGISEEELERLIQQPNKSFEDYPNSYGLFQLKNRLVGMLRKPAT